MTRETHPSIAQSETEPETQRNGTERRRSDLDSDSNPIRAFGRSSVADAMDAGATTDATCGEEINETDASSTSSFGETADWTKKPPERRSVKRGPEETRKRRRRVKCARRRARVSEEGDDARGDATGSRGMWTGKKNFGIASEGKRGRRRTFRTVRARRRC